MKQLHPLASDRLPAMVFSIQEAETLLRFFGGSNASVTVEDVPANHWPGAPEAPAGKYAYCTDCPEEGSQFLGEHDPSADVDRPWPIYGESVRDAQTDEVLLEVARNSGLRQHLHGMNATDAKRLLRLFVDALDKVGGRVPSCWIKCVDQLPEVRSGSFENFWVHVLRKDGKEFAFPAIYANAFPLLSDDPRQCEGPGWKQDFVPEDGSDDADILVSGWYDAKSDTDGEYDVSYTPVCQEGDVVIAWQSAPALDLVSTTRSP